MQKFFTSKVSIYEIKKEKKKKPDTFLITLQRCLGQSVDQIRANNGDITKSGDIRTAFVKSYKQLH